MKRLAKVPATRREFMTTTGAAATVALFASDVWAEAVVPGEVTMMSAREMIRSIQEKKLSSRELVQAHIDRIREVNPSLNAVVQLAEERALLEADKADAVLSKGKVLGPLHGVPMTIKDLLETEGIISTAGTKGRASFVPRTDATVVKRLRQAGAILLGKTNTPELSLSDETNNPVYGRTNNPYDITRTPGGSSGGGAAIVAAAGSPFDIGSDVGGSLRQPAHFCGVTTIKPTVGRVPTTGHIPAYDGLFTSLNHIGPIARYVEDLSLILSVISGPDWRDPQATSAAYKQAVSGPLKSLRIAWYLDNGLTSPTADVTRVVQSVVEALTKAGCVTREHQPPGVDTAPKLLKSLFAADGCEQMRRLVDTLGGEVGDELHGWLDADKDLTVVDIRRASYALVELRREMTTFMENHDVIICPVSAVPAVKHGKTANIDTADYQQPYNLTGWPAAVVRCGTSEEGLPIGVQVIGRPWREDVVLTVASRLEAEFGGWQTT